MNKNLLKIPCTFCGSPIVPLNTQEKRSCLFCGEQETVEQSCPESHHCCDRCKRDEVRSAIAAMARTTTLKDPMVIAELMMGLPRQDHGQRGKRGPRQDSKPDRKRILCAYRGMWHCPGHGRMLLPFSRCTVWIGPGAADSHGCGDQGITGLDGPDRPCLLQGLRASIARRCGHALCRAVRHHAACLPVRIHLPVK
jgi:hypothetical protein